MTRILVVDDDPQMQLALQTVLARSKYEVSAACDGHAALSLIENEKFDLVISDQNMPNLSGIELLAETKKLNIKVSFIVITAYGTITQAVEAMQQGAEDFITKPFSGEELLHVVQRVMALSGEESLGIRKESAGGRPIITNDPMMIRVLEVAEAVSRSDATVLIQGESGTGKELIARLIHSSSPRRTHSFVAVNCAALPETLLESELFGHEKGAFTGAQARKIGKFELAHGGTILLDEISEMELVLQAKLLRVLQEREVDRVGGKEPVSIDVRVLATTNRNLEHMVSQGRFRADLYYRLNVIPLTLPPLRQRRSDIRLLVEHFMRHFLGAEVPDIPHQVREALESHQWPGNIRELQNAVERAAILSRGKTPRKEDFLLGIDGTELSLQDSLLTLHQTKEVQSEDPSENRIEAGMTVHEVEKRLIIETLRSTSNNRTQAAKLLGISIRTLRNKLNEYQYQQ
jgi:DNA-binding NtrC family response regulator